MRGLRLQLTAVVVATVSCSLLLIGVLLLPTLSAQIRRVALEDLGALATSQSPRFRSVLENPSPTLELRALTERVADETTTRVSVLGVAQSSVGIQLFYKADSAGVGEQSELQFPAAVAASAMLTPQTAAEAGPNGRIGEAAVPIFEPGSRKEISAVLVLSRPLQPDRAVVRWATGRLAIAAAIALLVALLAGIMTALRLTRRIRELEFVAENVAAGDLATRFPTNTQDEFGALGLSLEDMRIQLAELDSARKRFIATASHELRTPLFSLGGFLELLEDEDLDEADRRSFVNQLREQVVRMQALATDLLDLSRIDAGALELYEQAVDLRSLARDVAAEFALSVAAHEAHLELRIPDRPLHAMCDPDRVTQVLRILISNALTHTPKGTDIVLAVAQRGNRARLSVADHGPGISRTVLPTIFEPFATTDDMQGTGLGLAIARELATKMNGELKVDSRPGLTRFTLDLAPSKSQPEVDSTSGVG